MSAQLALQAARPSLSRWPHLAPSWRANSDIKFALAAWRGGGLAGRHLAGLLAGWLAAGVARGTHSGGQLLALECRQLAPSGERRETSDESAPSNGPAILERRTCERRPASELRAKSGQSRLAAWGAFVAPPPPPPIPADVGPGGGERALLMRPRWPATSGPLEARELDGLARAQSRPNASARVEVWPPAADWRLRAECAAGRPEGRAHD